jgi:hypothetical protein
MQFIHYGQQVVVVHSYFIENNALQTINGSK